MGRHKRLKPAGSAKSDRTTNNRRLSTKFEAVQAISTILVGLDLACRRTAGVRWCRVFCMGCRTRYTARYSDRLSRAQGDATMPRVGAWGFSSLLNCSCLTEVRFCCPLAQMVCGYMEKLLSSFSSAISCLRTCARTDCGTSVRERAEEQGAGCWGPGGGISVNCIEPCLAMARSKLSDPKNPSNALKDPQPATP